MTAVSTTEEHGWVMLESDELHAAIDPLGAQLSILRDKQGRDLLWDGDPTVWKGRAPLLFPIVGALREGRYRLGPKSYALARHGFAREKRFELTGSTGSTAEFRLRADPETLDVYPFQFALSVRYELAGATLSIQIVIRNDGWEPMPSSFGYHPALRWPLPYGQARSEHFIEFEREEPAPIRRLDSKGLLSPLRYPTPMAGRRLSLVDSLFQDDAVILDQVRSQRVTYGAKSGPRLELSFPDTPYFGVWTKPGAHFICVEPWHGIADPEGFDGDFNSKPGIFIVPAGGAAPIEIAINLVDR